MFDRTVWIHDVSDVWMNGWVLKKLSKDVFDGFADDVKDIQQELQHKDAVFYTTTSHFVAWFGVFSQERQWLWLRSQQHIVATVEDSVLRTEMAGLESQEEDDPKRILFFKSMSWLGQIGTHRRDEAWSASL